MSVSRQTHPICMCLPMERLIKGFVALGSTLSLSTIARIGLWAWLAVLDALIFQEALSELIFTLKTEGR